MSGPGISTAYQVQRGDAHFTYALALVGKYTYLRSAARRRAGLAAAVSAGSGGAVVV
jgi:hypothetical protein